MVKKIKEKFLTKDDIQHLPEAERMLKLEMYTGCKEKKPREEWIYDFEDGKIIKNVITLPECIERCFLEPLSNAADNINRSRRFKSIDCGKIYVFISPDRIVIENGGTPIPLDYKEEEDMYTPALLFGIPGTSSNYTEERHESGVNGLGVKLTNGFSKYFKVEILNPKDKKSYTQEWVGMGLDGRQDPIMETYKDKNSLIRVTFDLDFEHFGYKTPPEDLVPLFARCAADISFTTKVPVTFEYVLFGEEPQAIEFDLGHPRHYAFLYFGDLVENSILHYEWPENAKITKEQDGRQIAKNGTLPLVEMLVIDTPDSSENISFANSMMTRDGGIHVETALKAVSDHIVKFINENDDDGLTVTLKHIRPNISLVITCMVKNPSYQGQTKNKLSGPTPRIRVQAKEIKPVKEWEMIKYLQEILQARKNALLSKTDGKKRRNIFSKNGQDANKAGTKKSSECTLCIVEGLSASAYPQKFIDCMDNGKDTWGILPIRGKFLNIMKAKFERIAKNNEICELKKMLGLEEGKDYSIEQNRKSLRYGRVVIMADADDDGKHIVALLLLYFHCRFSSLLQSGFVYNYLTPIIRVSKGRTIHKFYAISEFEKWKRRNKNWETWKTTYFKGLGRADDNQIKDDFKNQRIIHCLYDDFAPQTINLAFSKESMDERKAWLAHFRDTLDVEVTDQQPISEYINTELVKYGRSGLRRAIPNEIDGFKDAQRKAMWAAFKIWNGGELGKITEGKTKEIKVAQFAAQAGLITNYHHGERSLEGTIIAMAQDFCGSNNLPYFARAGQFGTRARGGQDASDARYIQTKPESWIPLVYRQEDLPILQLKEDEGANVEPQFFLPIIPTVLINGANGIALAYSTYIPNHNPLDVVNWLKCKIEGKRSPKLKPWFRGFSGSIEIIDRRKNMKKRRNNVNEDVSLDIPDPAIPKIPKLEELEKEDEKNEEDEGNNNDPFEPDFMKDIKEYVREYREEKGRPMYSLITKGEFYVHRNGKVIITELPIGRWTHPYSKWLEKLRDENKIIKDVRDLSKSDSPYLELNGYKPIPSHKSLALIRQYGMSNMHLLGYEDKPVRYDSAEEYLEIFYEKRLYYYGVRKEHVVRGLREKLPKLIVKQKFIQSVVNKELIIENRKKDEIFADMDRLEIPRELLSKTSVVKLTEDGIKELDDKIKGLENDINIMESTPPEKMWLSELKEFEKEYRKHYKVASKGDKLKLKVTKR